MYGLCCAYGIIMFGEYNPKAQGYGVKINLGCALMMGLWLAFVSDIKCAIGGPDLNPVVFLGAIVTKIATEVAYQKNLVYPDAPESCGRRLTSLVDGIRHLGSSSGSAVEFCSGTHYTDNMSACDSYLKELLATSIFATTVSTLMFGVLFFSLGYFKVTNYVNFVPTSIMEAFLSCVGYKVFKYALKFCNKDPKQFLPAAIIGVTMYMMKSRHIGNPAVVLPLMILVPLGIFYAISFSVGEDIDSLRYKGWMFPEISDVDFYQIWTDGILSWNNINWQAFQASLPELPIMVIVCVLDCLLKLSSTESKLPVKANKDKEMKIYGMGNMLMSITGSSVGYMQLKFNVINAGVMGSVTSNWGSIMFAVFCGAMYFVPKMFLLFNYLPRLFLGILLFFAGAGFVAENLWGSKKFLSNAEWMQIVVVLLVFILSGQLLHAVLAGLLLVGISFIVKYAHVPCVLGVPAAGVGRFAIERHDFLMERKIQHVSENWLLVIRLKGYLFFASAQHLYKFINSVVDKGLDLPPYRRMKYIMFDCDLLDGMDASAFKTILKIRNNLSQRGVKLMWSSIGEDFANELEQKEIIQNEHDCFETVSEAVHFIEKVILDKLSGMHSYWTQLHPTFNVINALADAQMRFSPFGNVQATSPNIPLTPWQFCSRHTMTRHRTILWKPGENGKDIFLVHRGKVALFEQVPSGVEHDGEDWRAPLAVYGHGWFINREFLLKSPTQYYAVAYDDGELISWNEYQWNRMLRERPAMVTALMKMALRQQDLDKQKMNHLNMRPGAAFDQYASIGEILESLQFDDAGSFVEMRSRTSIKSNMRSSLSSYVSPHANTIPAELQEWTYGIEAAKALEQKGFFTLQEGYNTDMRHPELPMGIYEDLFLAFQAYRMHDESEGTFIVPWKEVPRALMYAGIFNFIVKKPDFKKKGLTEAEFMALGHEITMTRLSNKQVEELKAIFQQNDEEGKGRIDGEKLTELFRNLVHKRVTVDEISGISAMWDPEGLHGIDEDRFIGIMSRFLSIHKRDWMILRALREIFGKPALALDRDKITPEILASRLAKFGADCEGENAEALQEKMEELIWSEQLGKTSEQFLDIRQLGAIMQPTLVDPDPLPPAAQVPDDSPTEVPVTSSADIRRFIVDLEVAKPEDLEWMNAEEGNTEEESKVKRLSSRKLAHDEHERRKMHTAMLNRQNAHVEEFTIWQKVYLVIEEGDVLDNTHDLRLKNIAYTVQAIISFFIVLSVLFMILQPLVEANQDPCVVTRSGFFYVSDWIMACVFTIEFILRFTVCDSFTEELASEPDEEFDRLRGAVRRAAGSRVTFLLSVRNIVDLMAVLPFWVTEVMAWGSLEPQDLSVLFLLRIVRIVRVSRLMRLGRVAEQLQHKGGISAPKVAAALSPIAVIFTLVWGIYLYSTSQDCQR
jgi:MFS superfamily sulfate permease-like transporter